MLGVQDYLEKRAAESGRLCHSTGWAAESILPAPSCEVGQSTAMPKSKPSSGSRLSVSANLPSSLQHPQQQRHHMYPSFTLAVGETSPSAEEDIPKIEARW